MKETRIIAICNLKGGVAKTTTAINVGAALARSGKRVLLIDADAQASLSISLGIDELSANAITTNEILTEGADIADAILDGIGSGYDVVPTDLRLCTADLKLNSVPAREYILKDALKAIKSSYDYILIDCPPSLSLVTYNCLTAAQELIIPLQSSYLALSGISYLLDAVDTIKQRVNPGLEISGVLLTMFNGRTKHAKSIKEQTADYFKDKLFKTVIRQNIAISDAQGYAQDIFQYDSKSNGAEDYAALTKEIIRQEAKK